MRARGVAGTIFPMSIRRAHLAIAAAAVAGVVGAASANAKIVPQEGIAGANVGMTQEKVLDKLGEPDRTRILTSPIGGFDFVELKYGRTKISFDGIEASSEVLGVSTKDPDERTSKGVGVGSTKQEVKAGVEGVVCAEEFGVNHCYLGKFRIGEIVTDFSLKERKSGALIVNRVGVGRVLD